MVRTEVIARRAEAARGDLVVQEIIAEAGAQLGVAIAGLVNLINPNMVVVGGLVAEIGDLFLEPVRRAARLPASASAVQITTALLGRRSIATGAVVQAASVGLHRIANGRIVKELTLAHDKSLSV